MTAFAAFVDALRQDARYSFLADGLLTDFQKIDRASVHSHDEREHRKALLFVANHPMKTIEDKIIAMEKIESLPNCHVMIPSMRRFLEW